MRAKYFEWEQFIAGDPRGARTLAPAAILAATFLAYVATLDLGFVFDDQVLVISNGSIRYWRFFPSYFASHIWISRYPHLLANYYHPFFLTWLRLNDALFGLHPWGWQLTSTLAHVAVNSLAKQEIETELASDPQNSQAQALLKDMGQQIQASLEKLSSIGPAKAVPEGIK